jgi:hypothetical protein
VEFDPRVANCIVMEEALCDGFDGRIALPYPTILSTDLVQVCDNGGIGSLPRRGRRVLQTPVTENRYYL